jgi:CheY-like chemotaxis protein
MSQMPQLLDGWTVLVVDDEEDSLDVARRLLKKAGAKVLTASNGEEALSVVRQQKPDCVLSDLSMPEMDGWLLMRELNTSRPTEEIPVIALTAHAMPGDRLRAIEAGFVNYITKPLDARKFVQQLLAILVDIPDLAHRFAAPEPEVQPGAE